MTTKWSRVKRENEAQESKGDDQKGFPTATGNTIRQWTRTISLSRAPTGAHQRAPLSWGRVSLQKIGPPRRHSHSAVVYNDSMYVYGGWMADWSKGDSVWRLDLTTLTWNEIEVTKSASVPERRFGHIAAVYDDRMYIFGGNRSTKTTNETHTGVVVENSWVVHGGVSGESGEVEIRNDAFSFDFRSATWTPLPQLNVKMDDQPVDSHSGCVVSSEFSHTLYLLFGRRRSNTAPPPPYAFVLDVFRPSAHLQIEDDEACLMSASRLIETRSIEFFRSTIDQLSEQLAPMRNSLEEDVLPSLEKHLQRVAAKIASSGGETDDASVTECMSSAPECNAQDCHVLKRIVEGLKETDRMYTSSLEGNLSDKEFSLVETFLTILSDYLECSEEELDRFMHGENLPLETSEQLKRMLPALELIDDYRCEIVDEFISPGVERIQEPIELPKITQNFTHLASEAAEQFQKAHEGVKDSNLPPKQRKIMEVQKAEAGKSLLALLQKKTHETLAILQATPLGDSVSIEKMLDVYDVSISNVHSWNAVRLRIKKKALKSTSLQLKRLLQSKTRCCHTWTVRQALKGYSFHVIPAEVAKEKRRSRLETLSQLEEKRASFVARRSKLLDEMRVMLEAKLETYNSILQEERQLLLEAELYKREGDEVSRRIAEMKHSADRPRLRRLAAQSALGNIVSPVIDALAAKHKTILAQMEKVVGEQGVVVAEDAAKDVARFGYLMNEIQRQLEKQLAVQENSHKMIQSRIESKRDYLTVAMAEAGPATIDGTQGDVEAQIEQLKL
ncbi:uncharacterized protein LOC129617533 [Condylostylus longicornis]|uniref:uncharacterized protein LOC129617533 n=1 Tax=Condylostylus longicornis TaxID=2530218 RepID=UPI00244DC123|nr:uncharacterized protein LOC129617533 [Condylostylus longicornis]